jgi:hypothetical protein
MAKAILYLFALHAQHYIEVGLQLINSCLHTSLPLLPLAPQLCLQCAAAFEWTTRLELISCLVVCVATRLARL